MSRPRSPKPLSSIRIISGQWRGRRIPVLADGVRPTGDRVRETLFNWLQPYVVGSRCLDLFAGAGALGLEALSRGAESVTFVDQDARAVRQLKETLSALASHSGRVLKANALTLDYAACGPFDLVFLDPPFGSLDLGNLCTLLETSGSLATPARIYMEMRRQDALPELPEGWDTLREREAGQVRFALLERAPMSEQE